MSYFSLRNSAVAFSVIASITLTTPSAQGFGTVRGLGQNAEHEKITRLALAPMGFQPRTLDAVAGKNFSFGAVGAPDNPLRGLISRPEAHCDGGDHLAVRGYPQSASVARRALQRCKSWITRHINEAIADAGAILDSRGRIRRGELPGVFTPCNFNGLKGRAKCNVLDAFGVALHASQDFYAHTNWTDDRSAGGRTISNPPGLGNTVAAPWIKARSGGAFPRGLISGCFEGIPESRFCRDRIKHDVLNKDKGSINVSRRTVGRGTTPRASGNRNFQRAVRAAIVDTQQQFRILEAGIISRYGSTRGRKIVCAILHDNPTRTC